MNTRAFKDNGGRRSGYERRIFGHRGPVLEKRLFRDRRRRFDRRRVKDPALRIVGDERRRAMQNLS